MYDVRRANRNIGHHWFDPSTIRCFRSRVSERLYAGAYFVSSERCPYVRRYTVREANADGSISTVGDFQQYRTRAAAIAAIRTMLTCEPPAPAVLDVCLFDADSRSADDLSRAVIAYAATFGRPDLAGDADAIDTGADDTGAASQLLYELSREAEDHLSEIAPAGYYFGNNDLAAYGFWSTVCKVCGADLEDWFCTVDADHS